MHKKFFLGVDEAGYGPNLGPLVVAASLWSAPVDFTESRFAEALKRVFLTRPYSAACEHVPLGDSKKLYSTQSGIASLETGLLALFYTLDTNCFCLGDLVRRVASTESIDELHALDWYSDYSPLPLPSSHSSLSEVQRLSQIATKELTEHGIELIDLRASIVCEPLFNQAVAASGSKGELLSRVTLGLVVKLLELCSTETEIFCDRQGGLKQKLPNMLAAMPDEWFREIEVCPARSSYCSQGSRPLTIHFTVGGDRFPATALASMLAKYLRERLMEVLNDYWCGHIADLRPTAGYPVDAQRFRKSIEPIARSLGWSFDQWWRCK